jgi:hypothetical protein
MHAIVLGNQNLDGSVTHQASIFSCGVWEPIYINCVDEQLAQELVEIFNNQQTIE